MAAELQIAVRRRTGDMLEIGKHAVPSGAIRFPEVLLRFLTDDELGELKRIVTAVDTTSSGGPQERQRAAKIIWAARTRAEMRHPGFE